jgi:hypothetical protein
MFMAITKTISEGPSATTETFGAFQQFTQDQIELFSHGVDQFMKWERERIFKNDPTPQEKTQHKNVLRMFLMIFRAFRFSLEPDSSDSGLREIVKHQCWRLEQSWKAIYEPMPGQEAQGVLNEAFPNDPLVKQLFPDDGPRA